MRGRLKSGREPEDMLMRMLEFSLSFPSLCWVVETIVKTIQHNNSDCVEKCWPAHLRMATECIVGGRNVCPRQKVER